MKKFLYLSLAGLMVLSSTTRCMKQIIKADQEVQEPEPTEMLEGDAALQFYGPHLPVKEEIITTFLEAAAVVAAMGRFGVGSSESFETMKRSYATLKAINKGDKNKTQQELFSGYCSDDEEYYTKKLDYEEETAQKIKSIESIIALQIQPKIKDNQEKFQQLKLEKDSINNALQALYLKRSYNAELIAKNAKEGELLAEVSNMHSNSKEQENSLLRSRAETLIEQISEIDERIAMHKNEAVVILDADVSKSIIAEVVKDQVETEAGLLKEKAKLQAKLDKINAIIEKLSQEPIKGWFSWLNN